MLPFEMTTLFSTTAPIIREFTVGELYKAVRRAKSAGE